MGIPNWALGLGALLKAPEAISDGFSLYRGIRDDRAKQANEEAARASLDNLAWAAQEKDPAVRLENFREVSRDMSGRPLNADTTLALHNKLDDQTKVAKVDLQAFEVQKKNQQFMAEAEAAGMDPISFANKYPSRVPLETLQGANNILSTLGTGASKEIERRMKEQQEQQKQVDLAAFQKSISSLTGPAQSPSEQQRLKATGGYDPNGEADIRLAGADYNIPASDVNAAVSDYQSKMEKTPTGAPTPYTMGTGRSTETGLLQNFVLGAPKNIANTTSVAPAPRITINNQGNRDRSAEFALRKEFLGLPEVKEYPTIETNSRRAAAALKETGSKLAVDQSLITVFNKMIDPTSVVRESEYARTPQDMAVLSRIKGKWGKIQEGGAGLDANERLALARMITNFSTIASRQYNARAGEYRQLASEYGFDPKRVVARRNDLDTAQESRPIAPAGTKARVNGKIVTSDGKGGWR